MGLLDQILGNADQTQALGLLGAHMMAGNTPGGFQAAMSLLSPDAKMKREYMQAQIDETRAQAQERAAKLAEAQRLAEVRQKIPSLFSQPGFSGGEAVPQSVGGMPMFSQPMGVAPMKATQGGFDVQRALALGMSPKDIAEYAGLSNIGKHKVARTVKGMGPDGREYEHQVDEYGQKVGDPFAQYRAPIQVNQGDRQTFVDPYSLQPKGAMQVFQTPDSKASQSLGWANHGLAKQRLALDSQQPKGQIVETPNGFMVVDPREGTSRAVTGPDGQPLRGKGTDRNLTDAQAKANLFGSRMSEADRILKDLEGKYSPAAVNSKMAAADAPLIGGVAGLVGNVLLSKEGQMAEQAQRDFVNAVLRRESGAVISPAEFANAQKQYFPQPYDTPEVLSQKRRNRQIAIEGLMAEVPEGRRGVPTLNSGGASGGWSIQKVN